MYNTTSTMCSSVRGPAIDPSLVTWPMSTTGVSDVLANAMSREADSRTWLVPPALPVASTVEMVWIESTTNTSGERSDATAMMSSTSCTDAISTPSDDTPMRLDRICTWCTDSSAVAMTTDPS